MPKKYIKSYCMYCGKPQRLCVLRLYCEECEKNKTEDGNEPNGYFYDHHTGELRDLTLHFS